LVDTIRADRTLGSNVVQALEENYEYGNPGGAETVFEVEMDVAVMVHEP